MNCLRQHNYVRIFKTDTTKNYGKRTSTNNVYESQKKLRTCKEDQRKRPIKIQNNYINLGENNSRYQEPY